MQFADYENSVFPWIKAAVPDGEPEAGTDGGTGIPVDLMVMPFLGDLLVTFAVDDGDHFSLLQRSDVPEGMSDADLFALAKKNLTEQVEFTLTGTNYGGYGILAGGDHEAGALCLDFIWDAVLKQVGENLVIAVPAKDCLFMAAASDRAQIEGMAEVAKSIFENGDRQLTRNLFLLDASTRQFSVHGFF